MDGMLPGIRRDQVAHRHEVPRRGRRAFRIWQDHASNLHEVPPKVAEGEIPRIRQDQISTPA